MSASLFLDATQNDMDGGRSSRQGVAPVALVGLSRESRELTGFWLNLEALQPVEYGPGAGTQASLWGSTGETALFHSSWFSFLFPPTLAPHGGFSVCLNLCCPS